MDNILNLTGKILAVSENIKGIGENLGAARDAFNGHQVSSTSVNPFMQGINSRSYEGAGLYDRSCQEVSPMNVFR